MVTCKVAGRVEMQAHLASRFVAGVPLSISVLFGLLCVNSCLGLVVCVQVSHLNFREGSVVVWNVSL